MFVIHTGRVPAFKLYSSNTVYLHCNLQLCLIGEDCPLKTEVVYQHHYHHRLHHRHHGHHRRIFAHN